MIRTVNRRFNVYSRDEDGNPLSLIDSFKTRKKKSDYIAKRCDLFTYGTITIVLDCVIVKEDLNEN